MRLSSSSRAASRRSNLARWGRVALGVAALLLLAGCNWWRMDGHQSTIVVEGPVARAQRDLFYVTCWVTFIIFIIVGSVLAYATIKFRARSEADEHAEPPAQGHGNPLIELGLIGASVLALVIIAIPTLKNIWYTYDVPGVQNREQLDELIKKGQAYEVNATGYQWWFKFEYPIEQINGVGALVASNELVIPAGRPVRINVRTVDVIHSFWIPKLAGKVDMIPARANFLWLEAEKPGYFWGQCAEYCGDSHAVMRFRVIALAPREFNNWLDQQMQGARNVAAPANANAAPAKAQFASLRDPGSFGPNEKGITDTYEVDPLSAWMAHQVPDAKNEDAALIAKGKQTFAAKTCVTCHTVRGHLGSGVTGPDLTHVGARTTIAAGLLENNPEQLRRWIHNPGAVKPGNKMAKGYIDNKITLTPDDENALVAYLSSLK